MMIEPGMRTKPKVAYLVNQYPLGSHTFIRREITALEASGIEVTRISIRDTRAALTAGADAADVEESGRTTVLVEPSLRGAVVLGAALLKRATQNPAGLARAMRDAVRLGRRDGRSPLVPLAYVVEAARLLEVLEHKGVEHVHAHFGTNSATVALLAEAMGGPGFSFTAHGPEEFDKPAALALDEKISRARFVVGVSSFGRSQLLRHTPSATWRKVKVVPCGVDGVFLDHDVRAPLPAEPRLVCVGRLSEQKGQLILVEAAALLRERGVPCEVVLVGDGELRHALERAVAERALQDRVRFAGWADGPRVRDAILAARALVLPSFAEGLPVVLMEALALRRPVISTWVAGIPELVEPGACGWLVPAGDPAALADAMQDALRASPRQLERLGAEGRRRVLARHDARYGAALLAEAFRDVRAGRSTASTR